MDYQYQSHSIIHCVFLKELPTQQLRSPNCLVHCNLVYTLCYLHASLYQDVLPISSSHTTSGTFTSLRAPTPVQWVLVYNPWHIHVSPHHDFCQLLTGLQPLLPPSLSTPRSLSIGYSSRTSVTSMSLHTTPVILSVCRHLQ